MNTFIKSSREPLEKRQMTPTGLRHQVENHWSRC